MLVGDATDDAPQFNKSAAIQVSLPHIVTHHVLTQQTWLLGFEFPSTLIMFWKASRKITFVCSSSKGEWTKIRVQQS